MARHSAKKRQIRSESDTEATMLEQKTKKKYKRMTSDEANIQEDINKSDSKEETDESGLSYILDKGKNIASASNQMLHAKDVVSELPYAEFINDSTSQNMQDAKSDDTQPMVLEPINYTCYDTKTSQVSEEAVVNLEYSFPSVASRLMELDVRVPKSSNIQVINLAAANPQDFQQGFVFQRKRSSTAKRNFSVFYLVGMVMFSHLVDEGDPHYISVAFSDRTFPRAMAFIGAVSNKENLSVITQQDGVSLTTMLTRKSTSRSDKPGSSTRLAPASPTKKGDRSHTKLSWSDAVRPYGDSVPVYDGRHQKFNLEKYQSLPHAYVDVANWSAVIATFTVSVYKGRFGDTTSFNIQDVILLADPEEADRRAATVRSLPMWIKDVVDLPIDDEYVEIEEVEDEADFV